MTDGSSQGLFVIVAVVIFGIFVLISYILFRDTMKPSLARIYCDAFAKVEDMTGIKGAVCGDSGENGNGGDNGNETGDGSFLNSSKMEITGSTVFYYGTYMYGSNENIQVTKFNKSGDTYDGNYTIDLSKYASMSGMDANNWNGLMVQSPQLKIQFSDEDLALVDEDWLAQTNNGENVNLENAEGSSQINLDHENKTSTISAKIPLKDGTTKTVNFNVDTKNELFDMDTFKNEYKAKVTTTATIMSMDGEKLQSYDLTLELQKDGTQKVTLDTGGKINSDNVYNYMINFDNSKMILNNSDDYYKLGGFQMQGENTGNKTVFDADIPTGIQINDDGEGNFSSVTSMGSFLNMFANLEITIK